MFEINYYDKNTGILLGSEKLIDMKYALIPDVGSTLIKYYENSSIKKWEVLNIEIKNKCASIFLRERKELSDEVTLNKTIKNRNNPLCEGKLVEVDFGFKIHKYDKQGNILPTDGYYDFIQNGEIFKRRLCIVLSINNNSIQVIPITSQFTEEDTSIKLSKESLKKLYSYQKESFALLNMIKSVSYNRIIPPISYNNLNKITRTQSYPSRLRNGDLKKIKSLLLKNLNIKDKEKEHLLRENKILIESNNKLKDKYNAAFEVLKEGYGTSEEDINVIKRMINGKLDIDVVDKK